MKKIIICIVASLLLLSCNNESQTADIASIPSDEKIINACYAYNGLSICTMTPDSTYNVYYIGHSVTKVLPMKKVAVIKNK